MNEPAAMSDVIQSCQRLRGVVHLWSLDPDDDRVDETASDRARQQQAELLTQIAQTLAQSPGAAGARLWVVTGGAQPVETPAIRHMVLWELGARAAESHPNAWGGRVHFTGVTEAETAARQLLADLRSHDQVIIHAVNERYVSIPARLDGLVVGSPSLRPGATYLISGGLSTDGLRMARFMVEHGARRLVLADQFAMPERACWERLPAASAAAQKASAIRQMEDQGAAIIIVGGISAAANLVEEIRPLLRLLPQLQGVIHVTDRQLTAAAADADCRATRALHQLTDGLSLQFFVTLGTADAPASTGTSELVTWHRLAAGLPALSVLTGPRTLLAGRLEAALNHVLVAVNYQRTPFGKFPLPVGSSEAR